MAPCRPGSTGLHQHTGGCRRLFCLAFLSIRGHSSKHSFPSPHLLQHRYACMDYVHSTQHYPLFFLFLDPTVKPDQEKPSKPAPAFSHAANVHGTCPSFLIQQIQGEPAPGPGHCSFQQSIYLELRARAGSDVAQQVKLLPAKSASPVSTSLSLGFSTFHQASC